jgi:hypothetical protein
VFSYAVVMTKPRIPVILAPVCSIALLDPAGAVAAATTAHSFGTVQIVSGFAAPGYEQALPSRAFPLRRADIQEHPYAARTDQLEG